jgi:hypothetical protein
MYRTGTEILKERPALKLLNNKVGTVQKLAQTDDLQIKTETSKNQKLLESNGREFS